MSGRATKWVDRGSVSLFVVILVPVLVLFAGLVLDGGRHLQARRDASAAAGSAARAAIEMTPTEAAHGLDGGLAVRRARAELVRQGVAGAVQVSGDVVRVHATTALDFWILPGGASVVASARARAERGVDEGSGR